MSNANTITLRQYEDGRPERLGASELDRTARYYARLRTNAPGLGAYALEDYVQIIDIRRVGEDFEFTMTPAGSPVEPRIFRISLNGIVYEPGANPSYEEGYFRAPPLDELDDELEKLLSDQEPAPILHRSVEPPKHLEMPLPYSIQIDE